MEERKGSSGREPSSASTVDSFLREVARAPALAALPNVGQLVGGKYRIERLLGKGAMGAVFVAHHELLQQRVALKVMLPEVATSEQAAARFLNEARAAAKVEGDHVARVLDIGQLEDGAPFIALELLEGSDFTGVLGTGGPLSPDEAVDYVLQALEALAQAHALGIVHRDLKPANLFLAQRRDGTKIVKVLDFGISKAVEPAGTGLAKVVTQSSSLLGSPMYMAPEQVRNARTVDPRADIWAMGVILFELLAGRPPWDGETVAGVFAAILEKAPPPMRTFCPDIPEGLELVVARCLARDPSDRFDTVAELASALAPFAPPHARTSVARIARSIAQAPRTPFPSSGDMTLRSPSPKRERHRASDAPWASSHRAAPKVGAPLVVGVLAIAAALASVSAVLVVRHRGSAVTNAQMTPERLAAPAQSPLTAPTPEVKPAELDAGPAPPIASVHPVAARPAVRSRAEAGVAAPHDPFDTPR
jgi:serine/threonine protein kinase